MAAIPLANSTDEETQVMFPAVETYINTLWNVPVIDNIVENIGAADTTYRSLYFESFGNFAFNVGGMMELAIALAPPADVLALAEEQWDLMASYGVLISAAGAIYKWEPNQHH